MLVNNRAADRQAESGSTFVARIRYLDLLKTSEDAVEFIRGDAPTVILNREQRVSSAGLHADFDRGVRW